MWVCVLLGVVAGGTVAVKFAILHAEAEERCAKLYPYSRTKVIDAKCHYKTEWGWILEGKQILGVKKSRYRET